MTNHDHQQRPMEVMVAVVWMLVIVMMQVKQSMEMRLRQSHPLHEVVERVNQNAETGSYIGLVMAYPTEEAALHYSGFFVPSSQIPFLHLAGRRFNIGKIKGVDVIYVMTGEQTVNAGITVQILIDSFEIGGIVHYGTAGSANDSLSFGDVSVPSHLAFTASWKWKDLKLQECVNDTYCLAETPKVVYSLRGSTADIFVDNAAFREFLFKKFNVSTVDEESAAVVMTCLSNGVPCIVFRGVSDLAGRARKHASTTTSLSSLAAINALNVAVEFIGLLNKQVTITHDN